VEFDLSWLLIGLPVAFALGWLSSRIDLRQWRRVQRDSPRAYFRGLSLLLNEQQDKAVDAFIEAAQNEPDATELHFALGNLFRRRGEFERAVRVHEHLLARGDLRASERERAQHALAQDFVKAGLFDRAEAAWRALEGGAHDTEARLALLALYERSRDWRQAIAVANELQKKQPGAGSFAPRIAHYACELALEADAQSRPDEASAELERARSAAPQAPRPWVIAGDRAARAGRHDEALAHWAELARAHPASFTLVAERAAGSARAAGREAEWRTLIGQVQAQQPSLDLLRALAQLDDDAKASRARLAEQLRHRPTLGAAAAVLAAPGPIDETVRQSVADTVARAARPLQRYRCAACGFEAQQHFWQCPGCLSWDSYPPLRIDEQ
jgi:lipopolysaccharide biosynthesis regulator YciM